MSVVLIPLAQGFEEIEAVSIIDVLRRADIEVLVTTINDEYVVKGANGISIVCDTSIKDIVVNNLDMIVLPGGVEGTFKLAEDENVQSILKEMDKQGKYIGAICAAPFALSEAGVLKEKYTCYPSFEIHIKDGEYLGDKTMVVECENIITSRGPATAICFALEIVKKIKDENTYLAIKEGLLADYCS